MCDTEERINDTKSTGESWERSSSHQRDNRIEPKENKTNIKMWQKKEDKKQSTTGIRLLSEAIELVTRYSNE